MSPPSMSPREDRSGGPRTERELRRIVRVREEIAHLVGSLRAAVGHSEADFHHAICRGRLGDLTTDPRLVAIEDQETL